MLTKPLVLALLLGCVRAPNNVVQPPRHRVVMLSIDGLKPEYLASQANIPTLKRLFATGAHAAVRSVWPTVTYPAHATLVTGVRPSKHGIANNLPFDPLGKNFDGWYWYASDLRSPTLWDVAQQHGFTTANVYWPVTVGARFNWSFPQIWRSRTDEDDKLMRALSTPGLADEMAKRFGALPSEHRDDHVRANAAVLLLSKHPDLSFFYLTDLDTAQHKSGPFSPEAIATLEAIDREVARIAADAGDATMVVVSDHGFLPVSKVMRPGVLLRSAGLMDVSNGRITDYRAAAWKAGGTAAIVAKPEALETVAKLFTEAAKDPNNGIARVHTEPLIEGASLVLEAADGFMFGAGIDGPLVEAAPDRGAHGYSPERKEMNATLILAGPGVRPGDLGVVDMIDVAPTVAKLMGMSFPSAEGRSLDAALAP